MVMDPVRLPVWRGKKVTLMVHVALPARAVPQLLFSANCPLAAMLVIDKVALPTLFSVTDCEADVELTNWFENDKLVGERVAAGPNPVPLSETVCGLPAALSKMVIEPVRLPPAAGVKMTLIVQFAPAPIGVAQVLVWEKSPLDETVTYNPACPEFVTVIVCAPLGVPTDCELKERLVGLTPTCVNAPSVNVSAPEVPPPGAGSVTVIWPLVALAISVVGISAVSCVALT